MVLHAVNNLVAFFLAYLSLTSLWLNFFLNIPLKSRSLCLYLHLKRILFSLKLKDLKLWGCKVWFLKKLWGGFPWTK
jgi:hypothetical protein